MVSVLDTTEKYTLVTLIQEWLGVELIAMIKNLDSDRIDGYADVVNAFFGRVSYSYAPNMLDFDRKNRAITLAKSSIKEP